VIPSVEDRLVGPYPTLPTPFHDDQSLDLDGLGEIIDRVLAKGITGITLLDDMAESTYLTDEERYKVLSFASDRAKGRALIVASVAQLGTAAAVYQGKRVRDLGADALLIGLPQASDTPLPLVISHFTTIVRDVGLPTLYDHNVSTPGVALSTEDVGELFNEVALAGIKNGSPDLREMVAQIRAVGRPISMFVSRSADCIECLDAGGVGAMCPLATLMPESARRVLQGHRTGDASVANAARQRFVVAAPLASGGTDGDGRASVPPAKLKEALFSAGIIRSSRVRDPQPALSDAAKAAIRELATQLVEL
jgi:4-hydroxy-tetrahydrodipicolinate synthase